jgi:hypothetical protein
MNLVMEFSDFPHSYYKHYLVDIKNTIYCFPERMSMNGLLFSG